MLARQRVIQREITKKMGSPQPSKNLEKIQKRNFINHKFGKILDCNKSLNKNIFKFFQQKQLAKQNKHIYRYFSGLSCTFHCKNSKMFRIIWNQNTSAYFCHGVFGRKKFKRTSHRSQQNDPNPPQSSLTASLVHDLCLEPLGLLLESI